MPESWQQSEIDEELREKAEQLTQEYWHITLERGTIERVDRRTGDGIAEQLASGSIGCVDITTLHGTRAILRLKSITMMHVVTPETLRVDNAIDVVLGEREKANKDSVRRATDD